MARGEGTIVGRLVCVLPTGNTDRWPGSCAGSHNMLARSQSGIPSRGSLAPGPVSPSNRIARPVPTASGARPFGDTLTGFPLDRPTQAEPSLWRCAGSHKCWHEADTLGGSLALASRGLQKAPWAAGLLPHRSCDSAARSQPGGLGSPLLPLTYPQGAGPAMGEVPGTGQGSIVGQNTLTSESLKDLMCLGTTWYQLESCRGHGSCLTLYYDFKTC